MLACAVPLLTLALQAGAPDAAPNPYLAPALQLYDDLELDAALEQFRRAQRFSRDPAEQAQIHLYEGLIESLTNQPALTETDFRAALQLDPGIALPKGTAPKIQQQLEALRASARSSAPPAAAAAPAPTALAPPAEPPATEDRLAFLGRFEPTDVRTAASDGLIVAGIAAGVTGAILALAARRSDTLASAAHYQSDALVFSTRASSEATGAYVCLPLAVVLGTGGVVLQVLGR